MEPRTLRTVPTILRIQERKIIVNFSFLATKIFALSITRESFNELILRTRLDFNFSIRSNFEDIKKKASFRDLSEKHLIFLLFLTAVIKSHKDLNKGSEILHVLHT